MLQSHAILLLLLAISGCLAHKITITGTRFPVDLGNIVLLTINNIQKGELVRTRLDNRVMNSIKNPSGCTSNTEIISCRQSREDTYDLNYTPTREDYQKSLLIEYFPTLNALELGKPEIIYNQTVELLSSPKELRIEFERPDSPIISITDRRENEFKAGDRFKVTCRSEGSLPPTNISISLKCRPRNMAIIEHTRLKLARKKAPYELYFPNFDFDTETNPDKFSSIVAEYDASEELKDKVIPPGEKEVVVHFTASRRLDQCQVACSQDKAEVNSQEISVKYATEAAFILPRPENGFLRAGDIVGCYADGNPPPAVRLEAFSPNIKEQPITKDDVFFMESHNALPPRYASKGLLIYDTAGTRSYNDTEESVRMIVNVAKESPGKIRFLPIKKSNDEDFNIQGATVNISPNATIGKEMVVICYASNIEVHSRFIVTYRYNASLGVVLGICAGMLFLSVVILSLMVIMKRRQKQSSTAYHARKKNPSYNSDQPISEKHPTQGSTLPNSKMAHNDREYDYHSVQASRHQTPSRTNQRLLDKMSENPYETTLQRNDYPDTSNRQMGSLQNTNYQDPMSTFTRNNKNRGDTIQSIEEDVEKHYATLDFSQNGPDTQTIDRTPVHMPGVRSNSLIGPNQPAQKRRILSRSAATSSTTLFGAINKIPPRSIIGGSGGQMPLEAPSQVFRPDYSNEDDGKLSDVVAVLRPKESSINGVEAQKYEYLQSLLEMKRKKDSEFV